MISRIIMLATLPTALLTTIHSVAFAQPAEVRPLTYAEIRDVAKWAVEEKQVWAAPPELFSTEREDGTREYLLMLGGVDVLDSFSFHERAAESVFKTQVKLEQLRQQWTRDEGLHFALVKACDNAERLLGENWRIKQEDAQPEDSTAKFDQIKSNKIAVWQGIHDAISNWAREADCRFIGFNFSSRSRVWEPEDGIPFELNERIVSGEGGGLQLDGPDGVEVRIMPNLRRKLFVIRMTPREQWDWNITQVLKSSEPYFAFVETGGIYFMSARVGEKVRDTEFHVQPTDKKIQVILPAD